MFKGNNKIILNNATMIEALQKHIDDGLKPENKGKLKITDIQASSINSQPIYNVTIEEVTNDKQS